MQLRPIVAEKAEKADEITGLIDQYGVIGAASLQKVRAAQLQELKKKLAATAYLRVTKNSIMKRAIANVKDKPNLEKFEEHLSGPNIFLFTNINPFKLVLLLRKSRVKTISRAGDVAVEDVTVPAGNTGQPPGPIISQLNAVGLRTRIESGSVYITRDTLVAKRGEVITARLAAVLSKLGIKSTEIGLDINVIYDNGTVITEDQMELDLEETRRSLVDAHNEALNLSLSSAYPTSENIDLLLKMAHNDAFNLALNESVSTPDTVLVLLRKAHVEMLNLSSRIAMIDEKAAPTFQKS